MSNTMLSLEIPTPRSLRELTNGHLGNVDCVVILTDHKEIEYGDVVKTAALVVDTRNALKGRDAKNIVRL